jgi:hypothetical protein
VGEQRLHNSAVLLAVVRNLTQINANLRESNA